MSRTRWIVLGAAAVPVLVGATVASATFGPVGALAYGGLLLSGLNVRHLFHDPDADSLLHRLRTMKDRHR